ncbi:hypothetical protein P4O66_009340 [Electrophorus voltai]|uniref:Integrase catalytic domain-containing protein n=1 Tax=Electrophorus voltai TaxID=2609070 RepID=A0AAD9DUW1_9TELE|nr:hypothetical protein P4O66_009340 [Electrophorus voltai]
MLLSTDSERIAHIDEILIYSFSWDQYVCDIRAVLRTIPAEPPLLQTGKITLGPLTDLLWTIQEDNALVLQQPDPEKPFVVEGNMVILVIVDRFSKMVRFLPLKGLLTAWETAEQLFQQFGLPEDIVSDRGSQFTSRVWKELLGKLNITVSLMSGYHPEANGKVEMVNQDLGKFLQLYSQKHPETWSVYLPWAEYTQNSLHRAATGLMPFKGP